MNRMTMTSYSVIVSYLNILYGHVEIYPDWYLNAL